MSQLSHSNERNSGPAGRHTPARAQSAAAVSQHINRAHAAVGDYTLMHDGRQVRIGPVAFWIVVGTLVIMATWSIATGTYFAFREDVLSGLISRHARMQIAYEDRIAELRGAVDRITSRQLLDQEQFERHLATLLKRQAMLEQRTTTLADDGLTTGSLPRGKRDKDARLQLRGQRYPMSLMAAEDGSDLNAILARISHSLDRVAEHQISVLSGVEERYQSKARRMRSVLSDLGVKPRRRSAEGGPFIPVKPPGADASSFDRLLHRVNIARAEIDRYRHTLIAVPVRKPLRGRLSVSSGFGVRNDPFNHRPAMHAGLDLRGEPGEPVRATAAGRVTTAGWDGGYGKTVEIDHGHGLSTRFGHLSKIEAKPGQKVRIGQIVGRVGSTGRSTGPHLHYETRINGKPVDPQKFLRAGIHLGDP